MDCILFGLSLSAALLASEPNSKGRGAADYAVRATYYQSGLNKVVEPIAKDLDKKYIPDNVRKVGVGASFAYHLIKDNRIEYSWSF